MPGEAPYPWWMISSATAIPARFPRDRASLVILVEAALHQRRKLVDRLFRVVPDGADHDPRPALGGEHHDAHDALAVDLDVVAGHEDVRAEARGEPHELRRRPGVEPELVADGDLRFA